MVVEGVVRRRVELGGPWFRIKLVVHGPLYPIGFVQGSVDPGR